MTRDELINFRNNLINGTERVYVPTGANDNLNKYKLSSDDIYFDYDIFDTSEKLLDDIECFLCKQFAMAKINGQNVEEVKMYIMPLLLYDIDSIEDNPDIYVADNPNLKYFPSMVKLNIEIVINLEKNCIKKYFSAIVNYNKFAIMMDLNGYKLDYTEFEKLSKDIIEFGKEERIPILSVPVFTKEDEKKFIK